MDARRPARHRRPRPARAAARRGGLRLRAGAALPRRQLRRGRRLRRGRALRARGGRAGRARRGCCGRAAGCCCRCRPTSGRGPTTTSGPATTAATRGRGWWRRWSGPVSSYAGAATGSPGCSRCSRPSGSPAGCAGARARRLAAPAVARRSSGCCWGCPGPRRAGSGGATRRSGHRSSWPPRSASGLSATRAAGSRPTPRPRPRGTSSRCGRARSRRRRQVGRSPNGAATSQPRASGDGAAAGEQRRR